MVKTFKTVLQNQEADDLETWYTALGTKGSGGVGGAVFLSKKIFWFLICKKKKMAQEWY